jgi:hypothetical protein
MFDNLLDNALKYSAPGTPVRIELTRAGSKVLLLIRDAGCGIADIDSRQLFVPFFRAASSRRGNPPPRRRPPPRCPPQCRHQRRRLQRCRRPCRPNPARRRRAR